MSSEAPCPTTSLIILCPSCKTDFATWDPADPVERMYAVAIGARNGKFCDTASPESNFPQLLGSSVISMK